MATTKFTKTDPIKLFASFNRNIFIPLVAPNNTPEIVHRRLKALGARIGRDSVQALIDGKVEMVKDFEVVSVQDHHAVVKGNPPQTAAPRPPVTHTVPTGTTAPQQTTSALSVTPVPSNVVVQQIPPQPIVRTSVQRRGKERGLGYLPQKMLVPVRRGTVYARLMEILATKGATIEELMVASGNKTHGGVSSLLFSQIKEKGYGIMYDPISEKYRLIFPKGVVGLVYSDFD